MTRRSFGPTVLVLALAVTVGSGCGPGGDRPPNILFILVDTLRADHLGVYGYERDTSPNLDRLAGRGVVFERFYSVAPWTNPAMVTLFTGLYPQSVLPPAPHREASRMALPGGLETLPEALRRGGYRTVGLIDHPGINRRLGFARGFETFRFLFEDEGVGAWKTNASTDFVVAAFQQALTGPPGAPFFIYLHLVYPHRPYLPQPSHLGFFGEGSWENDPALVARMINSYDAEIRQTDDLLGRLVAGLEAAGLGDDTAIVFTSDHGEGFWEHDLAEHGKCLYDEMIRIPLVLVPPGGRAEGPLRVATPASSIDLFPTVLEMAGVEPATELPGRSLSRHLEERGSPTRHEPEWFFSESLHSRDLHAAAVIGTDGVKYIHSPGLPEEDLLFDLAADGAEARDLSAMESIAAYRAKLDEHRRRNRELRERWAGERVEIDEETRRRLEALGYVD